MAQAVADLVADAVLADAEASHLTKDYIRKIQSRAPLGFFVSKQPNQLVITKLFDRQKITQVQIAVHFH